MQNVEIARYFSELADLLEIQGSNPFRIRAYRNAARTLENLTESISELAAAGKSSLTEIPGIGKDLAEKITIIVESQKLPQLDELKSEIPTDVVSMLRIPGIGPKKVAALFNDLKLTTLEALRSAAEQGEIAQLKGFAQKTEQTILAGLDHLETVGQRFLLADAKTFADEIVNDLAGLDCVSQATVAGSCRRRKETVGDLDLLVTSSDSEQVMSALTEHRLVQETLAGGETKQRVRLINGIEMDLRVVPDESYGAALQYFTGSKEHNIVVRKRAIERGFKLNEYGLFEGEQQIAGRTEEDVYSALDLPWIAPELRENRGEIELAEDGKLPNLIELKDIRGDLHMHTTATDGTASIREMVEAAVANGYKYIAITDHSKRVTMANGLDAARLRKHWAEIEQVREHFPEIEILRGIECDILEDATLDLPDDVLSEADWVIAVLHYGLKQPRDQIQKRLLTAIRNPHVSIIGHPSGRLVTKRPGADILFEDIFKAAADHSVMMEINAHPSRLDLDDIQARAARDYGIPIVISTDAHSTSGFEVMQYGIYQARRAGLEKKDVANTRTWKQFQKLLK